MSQVPDASQTVQPITSTNLTDLENACWHQLASGANQEKDGFKIMTVATCTNRGADARIVVLRRVDTSHKYVWFHTDARTEKVLQLEAFPTATLLFWDKQRHIQLRLTVETRLHTDDYIADEHWESATERERKLYFSEHVPGTELSAPYPGYPDDVSDKVLSKEANQSARKNFAVIECRTLAMEYLYLSPEGQLRARFQYEPESKMTWLAP
ncbi:MULTISPECIES: pyridoxamine 5'-phosphate oxidase family protein [unclassified Spirosoma]|uniref:pyridoxamine 5'-phosphate oxidase family protein n=1 Tax=unclassified Spirosoma TaxID=2621999 RepID=UPI00095DD069|nr:MULTISPECIES: pyridoxamine 5'-phosphate oxidase family protein [unclassified Spirosoma]MBN8823726.1 pyridoxamine 5'-phosphate oxidase family protein [Spirosoma sp.]OJW76728.1 MAG: pyridoxamine 5'-phosphate oxidase [Spirosoma sp. 48-14]